MPIKQQIVITVKVLGMVFAGYACLVGLLKLLYSWTGIAFLPPLLSFVINSPLVILFVCLSLAAVGYLGYKYAKR